MGLVRVDEVGGGSVGEVSAREVVDVLTCVGVVAHDVVAVCGAGRGAFVHRPDGSVSGTALSGDGGGKSCDGRSFAVEDADLDRNRGAVSPDARTVGVEGREDGAHRIQVRDATLRRPVAVGATVAVVDRDGKGERTRAVAVTLR